MYFFPWFVNANQSYTIQLAGKGEGLGGKQQAGREEESTG
jgi:hypothetical protein